MTELKLRLYIEGTTERIVIVTKKEFLIGRLPECDLCLPFSEISRYHFRLVFDLNSQTWLIEDVGSTNGTFINQVRLTAPQWLRHGDVIQVGNVFIGIILVTPIPTVPRKEDFEITTDIPESRTILRKAEELQQQWIDADELGDALTTHQTTISRLKDLVEIAKGLNSAESLDAIFDQVKEVVFRELGNIDRIALLIDVNGTGELELLKASVKGVANHKTIVKKDITWISQSICQKVFNEKLSIKIVDAQNYQAFEGENSMLAKGIRGALAVPLWDKDQVVGVLYADAHLRLQTSEPMEDEDLSFFSTLANLVASSVQRWLLTRKWQGEAQLRQKLERYHSPSVVQQLISVGGLDNGRLPPTEAEISIIFADLVGFSSLSERLAPKEIAQLLNRLFEEMLHSVFAAGGTLDKFIGDCIMAFFGAPEPQADHADRAVTAALGMLSRLDELNQKKVWNEPLQLRIAINSGKAVVGDLGSSQRVDYTVLGTTVNLASRMETACAPGECLISEATYNLLSNPKPFFAIGESRFKGINNSVKLYQTQRRILDH